jgi:hypothetical protein
VCARVCARVHVSGLLVSSHRLVFTGTTTCTHRTHSHAHLPHALITSHNHPPPDAFVSHCALFDHSMIDQRMRSVHRATGLADQYASMISNKMGGALGNTCAWAAFLGNVGTESAGLTEWTQ